MALASRRTRRPSSVFPPAHQTGALQARDDTAHRWRADLLGLGKLAERSRATSKHQNRKRGELRRANTAFAVAHAQPPQQVNRRGVQPVGGLGGLPTGQTFWT